MNIKLRLIEKNDKEEYWKAGFENPDEEMLHYTATTEKVNFEIIDKFVDKLVDDEARRHFLIIGDDKIIGETSLMDIDFESRICGFRIALFNKEYFGMGIGYRSVYETIKYAFEELKLHRIELEVFDYNKRAKRTYEKVGFKEEGRQRDGLFFKKEYHDVILMSILEGEFIA